MKYMNDTVNPLFRPPPPPPPPSLLPPCNKERLNRGFTVYQAGKQVVKRRFYLHSLLCVNCLLPGSSRSSVNGHNQEYYITY